MSRARVRQNASNADHAQPVRSLAPNSSSGERTVSLASQTYPDRAPHFDLAHIPLLPPSKPMGEPAVEAIVHEAAPQIKQMQRLFLPAVQKVSIKPVLRKEEYRERAAQREEPVNVRHAAHQGVLTPSTHLPHLEQVQRAFGSHDVSPIQAHIGTKATLSAMEMNAAAYAIGDHAVFAGQPDLYTVAHEAAHVIQQRGNIQLSGGVGRVGDKYERQADAVAKRVVAGQLVEDMLAQFTNHTVSKSEEPRGERAVSKLDRMQAERGAADHATGRGRRSVFEAPVQRLIGFEIEAIHVPVTIKGAGGVPAIKRFLAEGVVFETIPPVHATWDRESDHGSIGKTIEAERANWEKNATANKADLVKPATNASHIEYRTSPFDEARNATYIPTAKKAKKGYKTIYGLTQMATTIGEIQKDINTVKALTANTQDFGNVQIGVPLLNDWKAAALYYGIPSPDTFATTSRNKIVKQMGLDELYVQATVGVLPEKITNFMAEAAKNTPVAKPVNPTRLSAEDPRSATVPALKVAYSMMVKVTAAIPGLVAGITHIGGLLPTAIAAEKEALAGYLTLVLQESLGSVIWKNPANRIGGVPKNMVSFLSKVPLHEVPLTLPASVRTDLLYKNTPNKFNTLLGRLKQQHNDIGDYLTGIDTTLTDQDVRGSNPVLEGLTPAAWMKEVLSGQKDRFAKAQNAGRPLGPENPKRGGRTGIVTNSLNYPTTRAIPLEIRHYGKLLGVNDLPGWADDIKDLVIRSH